MEIWKAIKGYEGLYEVSNLGNVKTLKNNKVLKPYISNAKYLLVSLYKNGKRKHKTIHRLVAEAFIPNIENKTQVNHIDGNKQNNNVKNLEWTSASENLKHAYAIGIKKVSSKNYTTIKKAQETCKRKIIQYDLQGNFIRKWNSLKEAGTKLNIVSQNISKVCMGQRNKAGGFIWRYDNGI